MSSVLVKGMKMPENCTRCDYIGLNVAIGCPVMSGTNGRATDCPLVALPDKHGRLVDADALRDRLRNLADDDWNANTTTTWSEAFSECADMVDDAPTIVEAEDSECQ